MWKTNTLQKAFLIARVGDWDRVSLDLSSMRGYKEAYAVGRHCLG